jgi:hypothetical protein
MRGGKRANSGRKQGTTNKYNLRELFESNGFDVGSVLIDLLRDETTDKRTKLELMKLVFPYLYAKPMNLNITLENSKNEVNEMLEKLILSGN